MGRSPLTDPSAAPLVARAVVTALTTDEHPLSATQLAVLAAMGRRFGEGHDPVSLPPLEAGEARLLLTDERSRSLLAHLVVAVELIEHPLPPSVERQAETYLTVLGIEAPFVRICRDTARNHLALLHADMIRNSWSTEQTVHGVFHGKLLELARSKLAYYGVGSDDAIAARWRALADCPEGSWGRGVADFYAVHGFPFPGEPHGIYEVGALHDWVHVLTDLGTSPEGEIDVFAFIALTMDDPRGFVHFLFTLALFQNASIRTVGGKRVAIARADTLDDPGAPDRLADALWRATQCTVDPMGGIDVWDHADRSLEELRRDWHIPPRAEATAPAGPPD